MAKNWERRLIIAAIISVVLWLTYFNLTSAAVNFVSILLAFWMLDLISGR